jgi:hypothetical protein
MSFILFAKNNKINLQTFQNPAEHYSKANENS